METFLSIHQDDIMGTLSAFDRMIFKGHLTGLFPHGAFARFLTRQGVLLKDFGTYVEQATGTLKSYAQALAEEAGRPFIYLQSATTKASLIAKLRGHGLITKVPVCRQAGKTPDSIVSPHLSAARQVWSSPHVSRPPLP